MPLCIQNSGNNDFSPEPTFRTGLSYPVPDEVLEKEIVCPLTKPLPRRYRMS
jgi:hypothetical protein